MIRADLQVNKQMKRNKIKHLYINMVLYTYLYIESMHNIFSVPTLPSNILSLIFQFCFISYQSINDPVAKGKIFLCESMKINKTRIFTKSINVYQRSKHLAKYNFIFHSSLANVVKLNIINDEKKEGDRKKRRLLERQEGEGGGG